MKASAGADRPRKLVVAGMLCRGDQILITQRAAHQPLALKWEFPGGKIEAGESPEEALRRELREEIGVEVQVHRVWDVLFHGYPEFDVLMLVYTCSLLDPAAQPRCLEVADMAWTRPPQMREYDILEADAPLVERLCCEGVPRFETPAF